jgi:hypothetical protein
MEYQSDDTCGNDSEETVSNTFIVSWDMTGLEAVVDITQELVLGELREKDILFDRLKDPDEKYENEHVRKVNSILQMMTLRARANPQRHYEIYSINTTSSIDKDTLEQLFNDNPQSAADLIRDRGTKLYSDRVNKRVQVIE